MFCKRCENGFVFSTFSFPKRGSIGRYQIGWQPRPSHMLWRLLSILLVTLQFVLKFCVFHDSRVQHLCTSNSLMPCASHSTFRPPSSPQVLSGLLVWHWPPATEQILLQNGKCLAEVSCGGTFFLFVVIGVPQHVTFVWHSAEAMVLFRFVSELGLIGGDDCEKLQREATSCCNRIPNAWENYCNLCAVFAPLVAVQGSR